ncbi:MAG: SIMPL domain-containing protein [Acidimicrobiia bacterium]
MTKTEPRLGRIAIAVIAVLGLTLAACGGTPQNITLNTSGESNMGISVSGTGKVEGTPDTVEVDLGVSVLADSVDQATASAAEKADALIRALTTKGVAEEDITTTNYSIYPEYDYSGNRERLVGYRVNNSVVAKIRNVEETGAVLDEVTAAAGDEVTVNGLRFSIEDNSEMLASAREAAWNDAKAKAEQLADLSGQHLGPAVSINESVSTPPTPIPYASDAGGAESARTPIEPGTSTVTITLQVEFSLES